MFRYRKDSMTNAAIEAMEELEDLQDDPFVGIFWYDKIRDELFGVEKQPADSARLYDSVQFGCKVKTGKVLHKQKWKKEYFRKRDPRFTGNYTIAPRGRVFEFDCEGFKVFAGDWIDTCPNLKELVIDEFQLPKDRTVFVKDSHWYIGHGWSDEYGA